jgi:hypothetical protein
LKIIKDYRQKYNGIDRILDSVPEILDAFHDDLNDFGSKSGRESKFSSDQMLRMAVVKWVESEPYRKTIIRVTESDFLRNFCRIGFGGVPNFTLFCDAMKCIKPETWKDINDLLLQHAIDNDTISGTSLRLDVSLR